MTVGAPAGPAVHHIVYRWTPDWDRNLLGFSDFGPVATSLPGKDELTGWDERLRFWTDPGWTSSPLSLCLLHPADGVATICLRARVGPDERKGAIGHVLIGDPRDLSLSRALALRTWAWADDTPYDPRSATGWNQPPVALAQLAPPVGTGPLEAAGPQAEDDPVVEDVTRLLAWVLAHPTGAGRPVPVVVTGIPPERVYPALAALYTIMGGERTQAFGPWTFSSAQRGGPLFSQLPRFVFTADPQSLRVQDAPAGTFARLDPDADVGPEPYSEAARYVVRHWVASGPDAARELVSGVDPVQDEAADWSYELLKKFEKSKRRHLPTFEQLLFTHLRETVDASRSALEAAAGSGGPVDLGAVVDQVALTVRDGLLLSPAEHGSWLLTYRQLFRTGGGAPNQTLPELAPPRPPAALADPRPPDLAVLAARRADVVRLFAEAVDGHVAGRGADAIPAPALVLDALTRLCAQRRAAGAVPAGVTEAAAAAQVACESLRDLLRDGWPGFVHKAAAAAGTLAEQARQAEHAASELEALRPRAREAERLAGELAAAQTAAKSERASLEAVKITLAERTGEVQATENALGTARSERDELDRREKEAWRKVGEAERRASRAVQDRDELARALDAARERHELELQVVRAEHRPADGALSWATAGAGRPAEPMPAQDPTIIEQIRVFAGIVTRANGERRLKELARTAFDGPVLEGVFFDIVGAYRDTFWLVAEEVHTFILFGYELLGATDPAPRGVDRAAHQMVKTATDEIFRRWNGSRGAEAFPQDLANEEIDRIRDEAMICLDDVLRDRMSLIGARPDAREAFIILVDDLLDIMTRLHSGKDNAWNRLVEQVRQLARQAETRAALEARRITDLEAVKERTPAPPAPENRSFWRHWAKMKVQLVGGVVATVLLIGVLIGVLIGALVVR